MQQKPATLLGLALTFGAAAGIVLWLRSRGKRDAKSKYPAGMEAACVIQLEGAKACILSQRTIENFRLPVSVVTVRPGQRVNGTWAFRSPMHGNNWVCGYMIPGGRCGVVVATSPDSNPLNMDQNVLRHEFGHAILYCNLGWLDHNPIFKGCFQRWAEPVWPKSLRQQLGQRFGAGTVDFA